MQVFFAHSSPSYQLKDVLSADTNFFDFFNFETIDDPTHGFVDFVNHTVATSLGMINYSDSKVYIGTGTYHFAHIL